MTVRSRDVFLAGCMRRFDVHLLLLGRIPHHMLFHWLGKALLVDYNMKQE